MASDIGGFDPTLLLHALGTAGVFGVVYLTLAGAVGQGIPLRRRRTPAS